MPLIPIKFIVTSTQGSLCNSSNKVQELKEYYEQSRVLQSDSQRNVYQLVGSFKMVEKPAPEPAIGDRFETRDGTQWAVYTGKNRDGDMLYFVLIDKITGSAYVETPRWLCGKSHKARENGGDVICLPQATSAVEFVPVKENTGV